MDFKASTRKTFVQKPIIFEPEHFPKEHYEEESAMWSVMITTKSGMLPNDIAFMMFKTKEAADKFVTDHPPGTEMSSQETVHPKVREWLEGAMDNDSAGRMFYFGRSDDGYLAWHVLQEAGITDGLNTSRHVLDYLGKQRIGQLKNKHGENWSAAAEFEYCWMMMPHSSPVFIAAAYGYHTYITGNDFSAGYLLRDLECLVNGLEASAAKAQGMIAAAKRGGEIRSARAQEERAEVLLEMERLKSGGMSVSSAAAVAARQGMGTSTDANRKLWNRYKSGT